LQRALERFGGDVLNDSNFEAFLVIELAGEQLVRSLAVMVDTVRELVGTMDFREGTHALESAETSIDVV